METYFAEIENGTVKRVIVADQAFIDSGAVGDPSNWVECSMDGSIRKNGAAKGYTYDGNTDAFISPQPFPSWTLDLDAKWQPPIEQPNEPNLWDETNQKWEKIGV